MRLTNHVFSGVSSLFAVAFYAAALLCVAVPARAGAPAIMLDGRRLPADVPAAVVDGHVLVPLRDVFERFGAAVELDDANQMAVATLRGVTVKVSLRSPDAWINNEHRTLETGTREIAGRILVPLRFIAQALGVSVDYDAASNTIVIVSGFRSGNFAAATMSETNGSGSFSVAPAPKKAPSVQEESPHQGELIGSQYPQIYARFAGGTSAVNPSTVSVNVDGQDVTADSTISSAYVSYTPNYGLQTGQHAVEITGAADDGTGFSDMWTFRIDAGSSSTYMPSGGFGNGFAAINSFRSPRFRFFPPGFSVFTPSPLFLVSGGVIEVIFVSRFFTAGDPFFSINGIPGTFPMTPWPGNPGFFWGFTTVPFGAVSHRAIISARFALPNGRNIVVHSTAPMDIEGNRRQLPQSLRYAVLPQLVGRPTSPHHLVVFRQLAALQPVRSWQSNGVGLRVFRGNGQTTNIRSVPVVVRGVPSAHGGPMVRGVPVVRSAPSVRGLPVSPVMRIPGILHAPVVAHPPSAPQLPVIGNPPAPAAPIVGQPVRAPAPPPQAAGKPKPQ